MLNTKGWVQEEEEYVFSHAEHKANMIRGEPERPPNTRVTYKSNFHKSNIQE